MSKVGYKYKKFQYFMNNTRGTIMKIIVHLDGMNMGFEVLHHAIEWAKLCDDGIVLLNVQL